VVEGHYENFPVISRLMPEEMRRGLPAVYAFARGADDFADEEAYDDSARLALLDAWEEELIRCPAEGAGRHPVFIALGDLIRERGMELGPFRELLEAFRLDCTRRRYGDWEEVFSYCRLSANPVGRILLELAGFKGEAYWGPSDSICTALQLANFWQDLRPDYGRGRIYIPTEELERFGVLESHLGAGAASPELKHCLEACVGRTGELFREGEALFSLVDRSLAFHLRLVVLGGRRVLEKIVRQGYDTLSKRPSLGRADGASIALRAAGSWLKG
jgi:squalene synthase HpnC